MSEPEMCHCGKPLHYTSPGAEAITRWMIAKMGRHARVHSMVTGKSYLVPRHYIALHGLVGATFHTLGFKEVENG